MLRAAVLDYWSTTPLVLCSTSPDIDGQHPSIQPSFLGASCRTSNRNPLPAALPIDRDAMKP
jgi:hypothetical protein